MLAIGRNLNQLARAGNAGVPITRSGGADVIEAPRAAVLRHAEHVAMVIDPMRLGGVQADAAADS